MDMQFVEGGVCAAKGFKAGAVHCGIRRNRAKDDLALIVSDRVGTAAAIYTQNKVKGAPILVTKAHLENGAAQAMLCNSGNANTCNADGVEVANQMCAAAAVACGIPAEDMIVASTGVIGQPLPVDVIVNAMPALYESLQEGIPGNQKAAEAIMTTDTTLKEAAVSFQLDGKVCHVGGICKGSGMIHPNMATMLCFVTSDVVISSEMIRKACKEVADRTFHMISVDGDTSTNDMLSILANGAAENVAIDGPGLGYDLFCAALDMVCRKLSRALAADGEGASKLLECAVSGAPSLETARKVAKSVICSSLFKAAMFGADANWGRVLCAIGYTDADFQIDKIDVRFLSSGGMIEVCRNSAGVPFDEELARKVLEENEIRIEIEMGQGTAKATAWGCDLTYDYVRINGDYRS